MCFHNGEFLRGHPNAFSRHLGARKFCLEQNSQGAMASAFDCQLVLVARKNFALHGGIAASLNPASFHSVDSGAVLSRNIIG
jgi:hypothetical protein